MKLFLKNLTSVQINLTSLSVHQAPTIIYQYGKLLSKSSKISMKSSILFLFFLFSSWYLTAQDTLKELNSKMYSKYYIINEDNTFRFYFHHCTGLTFGTGTIKQGLKFWEFEFDSLEIRAPFSVCTSSVEDDSISVEIRSFADQQVFTPIFIQIKNMVYGFDSKIKISKNDFDTDSIEVQYEKDTFYFRHDWQNCAEITLYLNDHFTTYISGGTDKLKKKKNTFYLKNFVLIKNEEKFWKKGRRKKMIYKYKFK